MDRVIIRDCTLYLGDCMEIMQTLDLVDLIACDPPYLKRVGEKSYMAKKYGALNPADWQADLSKGFDECWRVVNEGEVTEINTTDLGLNTEDAE